MDLCAIYMAPSSIQGGGFGLYTTQNIEKGYYIQAYSDAPAIPVIDYIENGCNDSHWIHGDYVWNAEGLGGYEADTVADSVMTFGALSNFHTYLVNVKPWLAGIDDTMANRYEDPSAGSFSYYEGPRFQATRNIMAGEEFFADYGESWLDDRAETFADSIPRRADFTKASKVLRKWTTEMKNQNMTDDLISTFKDIVNTFEPRVSSALPETVDTFKSIMTPTKPKTKSERNKLSYKLATHSLQQRDVKWIRENGICVDNIEPRKSTIPGVGRGAFTRRRLLKGSTVVPAPCNQIVDDSAMLMYDLVWNDESGEKEVKEGSKPIGKQLLVNYCFGHTQSKLLLCPQTNAILINHCSSRKDWKGECGRGKGPNAFVRWASWDKNTDEWLDYTIDKMANLTEQYASRGLTLEIVALRDILPGEEIFIDYGKNWEAAWEEHANNWKPPVRDPNYVPLKQLIDSKDLRTLEEQKVNPYPSGVRMVCKFELPDGYENDDSEVEYSGDHKPSYRSTIGIEFEKNLWNCEIIEREDPNLLTVRILPSDVSGPIIITHYPKDSVTFRVVAYKSDLHLPNTFRHFIEIDDDIFPDKWKIR